MEINIFIVLQMDYCSSAVQRLVLLVFCFNVASSSYIGATKYLAAANFASFPTEQDESHFNLRYTSTRRQNAKEKHLENQTVRFLIIYFYKSRENLILFQL